MPKPDVTLNLLVMIRTFSARLRDTSRFSIGQSPSRPKPSSPAHARAGLLHPRVALASNAGDTLIEVLISALLLGLIVVGTFSGLNSTNRSTSIDRSRSQADALAEHAEEQLRSEPIKRLTELTESHPLTENRDRERLGLHDRLDRPVHLRRDRHLQLHRRVPRKPDYIQTEASKSPRRWIGAGKSVEETGIISPPAGSALIVQVTESGTALQGAEVVATGPSPASTTHELETSVNGCAILAVPPGEYNINASKSGYVDPNGYPKTDEDNSGSVTRSVYIPAENTSKVGYNLGLAGKLEVKFTEGSSATPTEGDSLRRVQHRDGKNSPVRHIRQLRHDGAVVRNDLPLQIEIHDLRRHLRSRPAKHERRAARRSRRKGSRPRQRDTRHRAARLRSTSWYMGGFNSSNKPWQTSPVKR